MKLYMDELLRHILIYEKVRSLKNTNAELPKSFAECVKKTRSVNPAPPPKKVKKVAKIGKVRKWVRRELKRADGLPFGKWERAEIPPEIKPTLRAKKFNIFAYNILNFNVTEYDTFLKETDWTIEETKYLVDMYKKYSNLWGVIADRYSFKDRRRSIYEIRRRFHFIYDSMCESRRNPERSNHYDWHADLYNLKFLQRHYSRSVEEILNEQRIIEEASKIIENIIEPVTPQPLGILNLATPLAFMLNGPETPSIPAGQIQRGQISGRSSSSNPESRHPSVAKNVKFVSDSMVDYSKQIEPAKDTSVLRFFSRTAVGPHFRSQEIRLLSNVNQKKRLNIETVCDNLRIGIGLYHNEDTVEHYTRLASGVTAVTELKNVFDTATAELIGVHREYCEKNDIDQKLSLPKLPKATEADQVIWDKIDPNSASLGSLLKRKLVQGI